MIKLDVLKGKLREKDVTYEECAKALKMSESSFYNKISGKTNFSTVEASKLSLFLDLTEAEKLNIFFN